MVHRLTATRYLGDRGVVIIPGPPDHAAPEAPAPARTATPRQRVMSIAYDPFLWVGERLGMRRRRAWLLGQARGRVLEIGAGTGLNLSHYPARLDRLLLTEPDPAMAARLRRRLARSGSTAEVQQARADRLPADDRSVDTVVSTMVLCTVPDPAAALAEIRRVLCAGGRLLFCEHVLSEAPRVAARQRRWAGPWSAFAMGCRCDRPLLADIADGFTTEQIRAAIWRGMPSLVHPLVFGIARADEIADGVGRTGEEQRPRRLQQDPDTNGGKS